IPGKTAESVHQSNWRIESSVVTETDQSDWGFLLKLRSVALMELEKARQSKLIGKALEAKLRVKLPEEVLDQARRYSSIIKELLNCSALEIVESHAVAVEVLRADGQKCERCWHW